MSTDPYAMLLHRRKEIAAEIERHRAHIEALESEDQELATAERVLSRFGSVQPDLVMADGDRVLLVQTKHASGKPEGTPTTPNMIFALLREAFAQGKQGLEPKEMQMAIARRWWPSVKSEDVGPTAWRMWKEGRLGKDGSIYYLPGTHEAEKEAADLLRQENAATPE
ncbi:MULTISPECIES: hypothetical protein [unclassified Bradyrhizobium]|uniref:hypothetical protein n=1 Tax=unclassified Bradyrhizobium TaxID=2631580 RepID=UPI0029170EF1|nr:MULTISPECIES: hypothetical protein [unclassified Bradyrhizobium]